MVNVNSTAYEWTEHEQFLYQITVELRKIQNVYKQSPNALSPEED
jgi:hypothetical protein